VINTATHHRAVLVSDVSREPWNQVRIEAEASGLTVRVWVLRALRRACGLPEAGEVERPFGGPKRKKLREQEQEEMRRQAVEARSLSEVCGPTRRGDTVFVCKLQPGHAGECSPTPPRSTGSDRTKGRLNLGK